MRDRLDPARRRQVAAEHAEGDRQGQGANAEPGQLRRRRRGGGQRGNRAERGQAGQQGRKTFA